MNDSAVALLVVAGIVACRGAVGLFAALMDDYNNPPFGILGFIDAFLAVVTLAVLFSYVFPAVIGGSAQ